MMGVTPKALQDRKVLRADCREYLAWFYELSPTRGFSEAGEQPLEPSEVVAYLTEYGVSGGERRAKAFRMLLRIDRAYMAHISKKSEQARTP